MFRDNPSLGYLDNAATTQKPSCVIEAVHHFYECDNANPLRGLYDLAQRATAVYEESREVVAGFIGAASPEEIVFTRNASESLNLVAYSYGTFLKEGDELTEDYIAKLPEEQQEQCNQLNRRTEFRVLRTTYGLFDREGKLIQKQQQE